MSIKHRERLKERMARKLEHAVDRVLEARDLATDLGKSGVAGLLQTELDHLNRLYTDTLSLEV